LKDDVVERTRTGEARESGVGGVIPSVHDPERWRPRFPILASTNYLVTHSLGAMPAAVRDKLAEFADQWATRGVRAWAEGWWDAPLRVGNLVARLLNAPEGTVAMHQNVSLVQSIVASALDFSGRRNKVVYTDQNFPTNMYVWEGFRKLGARIECVKSPDGIGVPVEKLCAAIDEETLIVPISHVLFRSSFLQDARAICARAREVGALVLLDAYQSLGTVPLDVGELGVDMVCGGSVKWLCGGPGAAYLYVRPDLLPRLEPRITGWAAHAAPFDFEVGAQRYAEGAGRLLNGSPAVAALMAATAGYEVVLEVGAQAIRAHSTRLTEALREDLLARGFAVPSPADPARRGGTLTVALRPDESGPAFVRALEARGILVDHRPEAGLRVSPHFYTRLDELREFAAVLSELRDGGRWREHVQGGGPY
jgi:kynureninase